MVATRLAGTWTDGHTHGLVRMDELEVLITAECHLMPPDADPVTTPAPPSTARPTGILGLLVSCLYTFVPITDDNYRRVYNIRIHDILCHAHKVVCLKKFRDTAYGRKKSCSYAKSCLPRISFLACVMVGTDLKSHSIFNHTVRTQTLIYKIISLTKNVISSPPRGCLVWFRGPDFLRMAISTWRCYLESLERYSPNTLPGAS